MIEHNLTPFAIKFHFKQIYKKRNDKVLWFINNRRKKYLYDFTYKLLRDTLYELNNYQTNDKKQNIVLDNWKRIIKKEIKKRRQKES